MQKPSFLLLPLSPRFVCFCSDVNDNLLIFSYLFCLHGQGHTGLFIWGKCWNLKWAWEKQTSVSVYPVAWVQKWSVQRKSGLHLKKSLIHLCTFVCTLDVFDKHRVGGEEESHSISIYDLLPIKYLPWVFFSSQAKMTPLNAKIPPKTSQKINSDVFEIPEWICLGYLAWAHIYLFFNCRRDQGCVDSEDIWFVFCYPYLGGLLLQMVRNSTNLKQLCSLLSLARETNTCLSAR